jgi:biopolymer transport protein ExbB
MSFSYYRQIAVDHTKVPNTDQTDFPILFRTPKGTVNTVTTAVSWVSGDKFPSWLAGNLIQINGVNYTVSSVTTNIALVLTGSAGTQSGVNYYGTPSFATEANGGRVKNANGYDVYAYSDSGLTTRIPMEREFYSATTGEIVAWIKQTASHTSDTSFYMAYGDSGISTDPNSDGTYGTTSVWTNYKGVWHFGDGSTLSLADSSPVGGTLTNVNSTAASATAKINGSAYFSGSTVSVNAGDKNDYTFGNGTTDSPFSLTGWLYAGTSTDVHTLFDKYSGTNDGEYIFGTLSGKLYGWTTDQSVGAYRGRIADSPGLANNTWQYLAMTYSGGGTVGSFKLYVNGVQKDSSNFTGGGTYVAMENSARVLAVHRDNGGLGSSGASYHDEQRVYAGELTADWLVTEYNNQNDPSTFYTVGNETAVGGGGGTTVHTLSALGAGN